METYDIIVVGAGPAGLSFASIIEDKNVLVIDNKKILGYPVKSSAGTFTDTIHEFNLKDAVCHSCRGFRFILDNGFIKDFFYDNPVLHTLDFKKMESILAERVRNKCEILHPAFVEKVHTHNGKIVELKTKDETFKADIFVDASGDSRVLLKYLDKDYYRKQILVHGIESEVSDLNLSSDYFDFFFGNMIIPEGYAWVFPTGINSARVGLGKLIYGYGGRKKVVLEDSLQKFIKSELITVKGFNEINIIEKNGGIMTFYRPLEPPFFKNCFVIGDAASHSSSLLGEGIRFSLKAGKELALALNSFELGYAKTYFQRRINDLTRQFTYFRIFIRCFNWLPNKGIHALVKALSEYDETNMLRIIRSELKGTDFLRLLYTFPKNMI